MCQPCLSKATLWEQMQQLLSCVDVGYNYENVVRDRHKFERVTNGRAELIAMGACETTADVLLLVYHSTRPRVARTDLIVDAGLALAVLATVKQRMRGPQVNPPYRWDRQEWFRREETVRLERAVAVHAGRLWVDPLPELSPSLNWENTRWGWLGPELVLLILEATTWESAYVRRWPLRLTWRYMNQWIYEIARMFWVDRTYRTVTRMSEIGRERSMWVDCVCRIIQGPYWSAFAIPCCIGQCRIKKSTFAQVRTASFAYGSCSMIKIHDKDFMIKIQSGT